MERFNRRFLTAFCLFLPALATAQSEPDLKPDEEDPDEIIVTAQKRAENVQDVPIAIQVLAAENLETLAADNIGDIDNFVPGLVVSSGSPTQPRFSIRGIRTNDFGVGTDPAVGVYIDGVYAARSGASLLAFNDVERIEVIKGPQGTLFGRNSSAGAVSVITKKPTDEFEAELGLRYGNFDKRRAEGMLNIPIDDLRRQNNWAVRGALGWQAGPETRVNLTYMHDEIDQDARPALGIVETLEFPDSPPVPPDESTFLNPLDPDFAFSNDVINNSETRNLDEIVLDISHNFGDIELTSISSWRQFNTNNREDEDGTASLHTYFDTNNIEDNESFYQELRLAGETGPVSWLTGVSYFDETANQTSATTTNSDTVDTLLLNTEGDRVFNILQFFSDLTDRGAQLFGHTWQEDIINRGDYQAFAVFADATWEVNEKLSLTVGGRYTRDEKEFSWFNDIRDAGDLDENLLIVEPFLRLFGASPADFMTDFVFDLTPLAGIPCDNGVTVAEGVECVLEDTFEDFSPRVVVDYKLNDDTLLFASYAQGYKAGGFNSVEVASRFTNEDVENFEVGFKTTFDEINLRLNASLFHFKYDNRQTVLLVEDVAGSGVPQYLVQSTNEEAIGVDVESEWAITDNLGLRANMQYIDLKFAESELRDGTSLRGSPTGEPEWSYALGGYYTMDMDETGSLDFHVNHSYRGPTRCFGILEEQGRCSTGGALPFEIGTARERTDLRAFWRNTSEKIQVGVFTTNVFNNRYVGSVNNLTSSVLGTPFTGVSDPRFYGVDLKYKY